MGNGVFIRVTATDQCRYHWVEQIAKLIKKFWIISFCIPRKWRQKNHSEESRGPSDTAGPGVAYPFTIPRLLTALCWCIFNHFYVIRPESYQIRIWILRRSRSSKVTEFGSNRKPICDFLLVINTNLAPILHRFRDTAFDRSTSKIAIFGYPSCV